MQNLLLPFRRGCFKTIDIASQKRGVEAILLGKAAHVDFRMRKEEVLEAGGFSIGIKETFEADVLIQLVPMDTDGAHLVLGALLIRRLPQAGIPQQGLAIGFPIGTQAEDLAKALKSKNKVQGNFGETILENMLKDQGFREGTDYESEYWLRDKNGNRIRNEETGKLMRPDFVLHLPDQTDILVDSKMSLAALTDYFAAETDKEREDAAARNLESVKSHIKELTGKEYQKYVVGRKTLDFVIMFIPNYGAWQLAKMSDTGLFNWALERGVLITTEETLVPFLRLIHGAWVQKEQMENIEGIVKAAEEMVNRVGIFCSANAALEKDLEDVLDGFKENTKRLVDGKQSIVKAAMKAIEHGVPAPSGKNALPPLSSTA